VGIQGDAGTGKTYTLNVVQQVLTQSGYTVEGLAPSKKAVSELKDAIPNTETIQARLLRGGSADRSLNSRKSVLVIDEAGMMSTQQLNGILQQANAQNIARVLLVGDTKQIDSIQAGTPFHLLQNLGMKTARMDDNRRVRNENTLAAVNAIVAKDIKTAFEKLSGRISETKDIAGTAAQSYLSLTPEDRAKTAVITPSNATRAAITKDIREGLRESGALKGDDKTLVSLNALNFSQATAAEAASYTKGDIILAHATMKEIGYQKGHQYTVTAVDLASNTLILQDRSSGKAFQVRPRQGDRSTSKIAVYTEDEKDFAQGDKVRFRINDNKSKIANGDTAVIGEINDQDVSLVMGDGKLRSLDRDSLALAGMDHRYTSTVYDIQGETVTNTIVAMSAREWLADQKQFYVAVSRATDEVSLITNSAKDLATRLETQTGEKVEALEAYVAEKLDRSTHKTNEKSDTAKSDEISKEADLAEHDKQVMHNLATMKAPDRSDLRQQQLGDNER
jgi:hypothetical protein